MVRWSEDPTRSAQMAHVSWNRPICFSRSTGGYVRDGPRPDPLRRGYHMLFGRHWQLTPSKVGGAVPVVAAGGAALPEPMMRFT